MGIFADLAQKMLSGASALKSKAEPMYNKAALKVNRQYHKLLKREMEKIAMKKFNTPFDELDEELKKKVLAEAEKLLKKKIKVGKYAATAATAGAIGYALGDDDEDDRPRRGRKRKMDYDYDDY